MDISAEYHLDDAEIIAAIKHITAFQRQQAAYIGYCAGGAILLLASGIRFLQGIGATLAALAVGQAVLTPIRTRRTLEAMRPLVATPTKAHLNDHGCRLEEAHRTTHWRWSAFQKFEASGDAWLFFVASRTALIIPKRAFTDEQQGEIEAMIASHG